MEKINTPMMILKEDYEKRLTVLKHQLARKQRLGWSNSVLITKGEIEELESCISRVESILPTEREVIEKIYYDSERISVSGGNVTFKEYFTQKFKSYE